MSYGQYRLYTDGIRKRRRHQKKCAISITITAAPRLAHVASPCYLIFPLSSPATTAIERRVVDRDLTSGVAIDMPVFYTASVETRAPMFDYAER